MATMCPSYSGIIKTLSVSILSLTLWIFSQYLTVLETSLTTLAKATVHHGSSDNLDR